jgi:Putative DNA-binding domain
MVRDKRADGMILENDRLTSHERLRLYAQQYWWRLLDSLHDDFPATERVVGSKRFKTLSVRYLTKFPSRRYSLIFLGERFPAFISRDRKIPVRTRSLASDVAALEWAQMESFGAAEFPPLKQDDFAHPDFSRRKVFVQPFIRLLSLKHSADDYVENGRDSFLRSTASNVRIADRRKIIQGTSRSKKEKTLVAVYRHEGRVRFRRLTPVMFALLTVFSTGSSLEKAIRALTKSFRRVDEADLVQAFVEFARLGWICGDCSGPE